MGVMEEAKYADNYQDCYRQYGRVFNEKLLSLFLLPLTPFGLGSGGFGAFVSWDCSVGSWVTAQPPKNGLDSY